MTGGDWNPTRRFDYRAIFQAVWLPMFFWLVAAGGATLFGFPGVICITPLGWLMGINVGQRAAQFSANPNPDRKLVEAAIGGVLLGLFQGLMAALVVAFASPLGVGADAAVDVIFSALILFLMVGAVGATACAGLAVLFARQMIRKMQRDGR